MSGRSSCKLRRFNQHKSQDKPSNSVLYKENEKSLNDLIKQREQLNQSIYPNHIDDYVPPPPSNVKSAPVSVSLPESTPLYTPWKTPSSSFTN